MVNKNVSVAGSMTGYSFKAWLIKNKDTFKYLLMGVSGVVANISVSDPIYKWILTFAVPVIIKLGVDAIDFFTSDVKLN